MVSSFKQGRDHRQGHEDIDKCAIRFRLDNLEVFILAERYVTSEAGVTSLSKALFEQGRDCDKHALMCSCLHLSYVRLAPPAVFLQV
jgi:hypothetical protein